MKPVYLSKIFPACHMGEAIGDRRKKMSVKALKIHSFETLRWCWKLNYGFTLIISCERQKQIQQITKSQVQFNFNVRKLEIRFYTRISIF